MNVLIQTIEGIQEVLVICPCCDKIFRLVEGKFILPKERLKPYEYMELVTLETRLYDQEDRLESAKKEFDERLEEQRKKIIEKGRRLVKRKLKKIDPTLSHLNILTSLRMSGLPRGLRRHFSNLM